MQFFKDYAKANPAPAAPAPAPAPAGITADDLKVQMDAMRESLLADLKQEMLSMLPEGTKAVDIKEETKLEIGGENNASNTDL